MENINLTFDQIRLYIILINIFLGVLFGTFPLLVGIKMNNRKYGVYGFISAIIGGAILGVFLSYPIAAIFTRLILKKSSAQDNADVTAANENAAEAEAEHIETR